MKVEDQLSLILSKLDEQSKGISEGNRRITDVHASIEDLKAAKDDFERWRPQVDTKVADLTDCVDSLCHQIDELKSTTASPAAPPVFSDAVFVFTKTPAPTHQGASSSQAAFGPCGHGVAHCHRRVGSGVGVTLEPPPVKGEPPTPPISPHGHASHHFNSCCGHHNFSHNLPQLDFPKFNGSNPKLWIKQCESYFDLYYITPENWVKLGTINFTGTAACWMQTIELNLRHCPGDILCHNHTPFEVLYGHSPRHFGIDPDQDCIVPELDKWLLQRQTVNELLHQQLLRAQQRQKNQADKHRTERQFEVGDKVWLKLQPYAQASVTSRTCHMLSYRYFGPYEVEAKVGTVAYKLKLPPQSSIHPVFHVSLLKKGEMSQYESKPPKEALRPKGPGSPTLESLAQTGKRRTIQAQLRLENYLKFYKAIRKAYPDIQIISNCDGSSQPLHHPADLYDVHIYSNASYVFQMKSMFDRTSRKGPKVFVSEYAVNELKDAGNGSLLASLAEAAFLIGVEKNSDIVQMASYAPLFVNNNQPGWKWIPDAIVFNSWQQYGTPSYWMQTFFCESSGAEFHPVKITSRYSDSLAASAITWRDTDISFLRVKIVNFGPHAVNLTIRAHQLRAAVDARGSRVTVLTSSDVKHENSFRNPHNVVPVTRGLPNAGEGLARSLLVYFIRLSSGGVRTCGRDVK
ncbi:unnamed protein product [Miscanthus lutarioriparius]|uniref:Alpha-L-arabinofuranosidase C-terminal domain-containing protein n=1 Tax=Miscanthus lutarioriparius TaxID=422564 RepID=A0A811RFW4_9POAL|nr:unnamed protein product [Miscanthus lutarioriparius]